MYGWIYCMKKAKECKRARYEVPQEATTIIMSVGQSKEKTNDVVKHTRCGVGTREREWCHNRLEQSTD